MHAVPCPDDVRYALRTLRRQWPFTVSAVLTLTLAIGSNTTVFGALDAAVLRPLNLRHPDRIVVIANHFPDQRIASAGLSMGEFLDLGRRRDLFAATAGYTSASATIEIGGNSLRVDGTRTAGDLFGVLGVRPHLGRFYLPADEEPSSDHAIVLSHALWLRLCGGDPACIGRKLELDGVAFEIVGVAPRGFSYPLRTMYWIPRQVAAVQDPAMRGARFLEVIARMRHDVTPEHLHKELAREATAWHAQNEVYQIAGTHTLVTTNLARHIAGDLTAVLWALAGAVALVLLVACLNVASLQFVLALSRTRDAAVRIALGASRHRIARQILIENLLLAVMGGVLGGGCSWLVSRLLTNQLPEASVLRHASLLDGRVLLVTLLTAICCGTAIGLAAAHRISRADVGNMLHAVPRGATMDIGRQRLLRWSIVIQVAAAMILLTASGLMVRTLRNLLVTSPGFVAEQLVTFDVVLPRARYAEPARRNAFEDALLDRIRATPAVQSVATTSGLPFAGGDWWATFELSGRTREQGEPEPQAQIRVVSPDYFRTMRIPLRAGADFASAGAGGHPSVVVDETFARQFGDGGDIVGRTLEQLGAARIIGVVGGVRADELSATPSPTVYYTRAAFGPTTFTVVMRTGMGEPAAAGLVRAIIASVDPALAPPDVHTVQSLIDASLGSRRLALLVLGTFGILVALLTLTGVFGLLTYSTVQRRREIAIRIALGAAPLVILGDVVRSGLMLAGVGLVAGLIASRFLMRMLQHVVYGVSVTDLETTVVVALILLGATVGACLLPGLRAAAVDPGAIIRE